MTHEKTVLAIAFALATLAGAPQQAVAEAAVAQADAEECASLRSEYEVLQRQYGQLRQEEAARDQTWVPLPFAAAVGDSGDCKSVEKHYRELFTDYNGLIGERKAEETAKREFLKTKALARTQAQKDLKTAMSFLGVSPSNSVSSTSARGGIATLRNKSRVMPFALEDQRPENREAGLRWLQFLQERTIK